MKRILLACAVCLGLVAMSAWLVQTPAYAGSATGTCKSGGSVTCTGTTCNSHDWDGTTDGWCNCASSTGPDAKNCSGGGGGFLVE
ncbi:MAG: hypothetical protein M3362_25475 [Acidobacteriota bacterium]|nr:hypothetical protein [Acidobacteriota bacterium]